MSVSYNSNQPNAPFNADECVRSLCKDTKVSIGSDIQINFQKGWKTIFEKFVSKVSQQQLTILNITDEYDLLDIKLNIQSKRNKNVIWQALYDAHWESESTCAFCGNILFRNKSLSLKKFCKDCNKLAATLNKTGTWLDEY